LTAVDLLRKLMASVVCVATVACVLWQSDERAAVLRVSAGDKAVYFKRRVWGRNGSAVVISANSDWRGIPKAGDYSWTAEGPPVLLYQERDGTLHIWGYGTDTWTRPAAFPVPVVFHEVDVETASKMAREPQAHGLRVLGHLDWPLSKPPIEPIDLK
jgi:hypothetical protein